MRTTAAVLRDAEGAYALEEVELDPPRDDELRVRVVGTGMCHTDVLPRAPESLSPPPIVTGHEGAGVVEEVGAGVDGIEVGDHVVLSFDSCGTCRSCRRDQPAYCATFVERNLLGRRPDGSTGMRDDAGGEIASRWFGQSTFATHALATARNAVVVDRELPLELLGPLGCGIQTGAGAVLNTLAVAEGDRVVVLGVGAVGLAGVMAARVAGAETIVAVDLHEHRLELARELGATHTLVGSDDGVAGQVLELTGGGADQVLDTTGAPAVMRDALAGLRLGGVGAFVGVQTGDLVLDPSALVGKTAVGVLEGSADPQTFIPRMIGLWRDGRFPFDRLVERYPLSAVGEAEAAALAGEVVKPVLLPEG